MAFSNTFDTTSPGSAALNREELHDAAALLAPADTPIFSTASKFKAKATFVEWGLDKLASPQTTAVREGADVATFDNKFANLARVGNYVHKLWRPFRVSDIQEAVSSATATDYAASESKAVMELKRDIEATIMGTQDRAAEDGADDGYQMRGLGDWIDSTGPSDVPAAYRTPAASINATTMTESLMGSILTSIYRTSGKSQKLTLVADTALRAVVTGWARADATTGANRTWNNDSSSGLIKLAVNVYQGDHGTVSIVDMNPDCAPDTTNKDTGYFINPDYFSVGELLPLGSQQLANGGGGPRGVVDWCGTIKVRHPGAFGKITAV